jgi:hypothetical protein
LIVSFLFAGSSTLQLTSVVGQSVETRAGASLVSFARSFERVRSFRELLQTLDGFVGRNQAYNIVEDSFDCASKQRHHATHDASLELPGLTPLFCLASLVLFQATINLCTRFWVVEQRI